MSSTIEFYNDNNFLRILYVGGSQAGQDIYFPKNHVSISLDDNESVHVNLDGKCQHNFAYTQVSTTRPSGHTTAAQLVQILESWCRYSTFTQLSSCDALSVQRVVESRSELNFPFKVLPVEDIWTTVTSTATIAQDPVTESLLVTCVGAGATPSKAIVQSKAYVRYMAGNTLKMIATAQLRTVQVLTDHTVQIGLFDDAADKNASADTGGSGVFFRLDGAGVLSVVTRYWNGVTQTDTAVAQTAWNLDKMDGYGISGMNLVVTHINTYVVELCTEGAGIIRFGILYGNKIAYCHQIDTTNTSTTPIIRSMVLPFRLQSTKSNTLTQDGVSRLYAVNVVQEGSFEPNSLHFLRPWSLDRGINQVAMTSANSPYPVISVRVRTSPACRSQCKALAFQGLSNQNARWSILTGGTLTGGAWVNVAADSALEYNITATAISGYTIKVSHIQSANIADYVEMPVPIDFYANLDGTAGDMITLAARYIANNANCHGEIQVAEFY